MTGRFPFNSAEEFLAALADPTGGHCFRCNKELPPPLFDNPEHRPGTLAAIVDGGYMMFDDSYDEPRKWYLCHDCSAELFRFLKCDPAVHTDMRGLHPYMDSNGKVTDKPCCEFGYSPDYSTPFD